jgi:hypothetical protein
MPIVAIENIAGSATIQPVRNSEYNSLECCEMRIVCYVRVGFVEDLAKRSLALLAVVSGSAAAIHAHRPVHSHGRFTLRVAPNS